MKRDMDLIRKILPATEEIPFLGSGRVFEPEIEGYSQEDISYHVKLLHSVAAI